MPPKVKIFIWRLLHNGIPVRQCIQSRFHNVQDVCPRCGGERETALHCLVLCPFANQTWQLSNLNAASTVNNNQEPWRWWSKLSELARRQLQGRKELALAAMLAWTIWKGRNAKVFEGKDVPPQQMYA
ncbi:uncharacterized protein [Arachis hypogaea]|uniref:uncharacterized protein n=1 Tax=Arachis hypogaea TaxID=3818 RepID=UPI003B21F27D